MASRSKRLREENTRLIFEVIFVPNFSKPKLNIRRLHFYRENVLASSNYCVRKKVFKNAITVVYVLDPILKIKAPALHKIMFIGLGPACQSA